MTASTPTASTPSPVAPSTSVTTVQGQTVTYTSPENVTIAGDGRTLSARVGWGGCQEKPQLVATVQNATEVIVELRTVSYYRPGMMCPHYYTFGTASLVLDAPLDGRSLIDGVTGNPIPVS